MLSPADGRAAEELQKIPHRHTVAVRVLRPRSHEQLAFYWQILEKTVEATGKFRTSHELHLALKIATGRVETVRLISGRHVLVPDSVAFDAMSQDDFQAYFDDARRIIEDELIGGEIAELLAS